MKLHLGQNKRITFTFSISVALQHCYYNKYQSTVDKFQNVLHKALYKLTHTLPQYYMILLKENINVCMTNNIIICNQLTSIKH